MHTAKEMAKAIGLTGSLEGCSGMSFHVTVIDVRQVFDRVDLRVKPVKGYGQAWVAASRFVLHIPKEDKHLEQPV